MSYEETGKQVTEPKTIKEARAKQKALDKLEMNSNDINNKSVWFILWHLICRGKKLWFWCGLVAFGYVLGFLRVGL